MITKNKKFEHAESAFERWCGSTNPNPGGPKAQSWRSGYVSSLIDIESARVPGFMSTAPRHPDLVKAALNRASQLRGTHRTDPEHDYIVALADEYLRLSSEPTLLTFIQRIADGYGGDAQSYAKDVLKDLESVAKSS